MSALDQAISKAYAKDRSPAASSLAAAEPAPRASAASFPSAHPVEQLYRDGALYRADGRAEAPRVPMPHLASLPPTSPRRSVRRSLQRLLTASAAAGELDNPPEYPRIARKVIIRHISHGAAPPPLGMRAAESTPRTSEIASTGTHDLLQAELPPETIVDEPNVTPLDVTVAPQIAPLNVATTAHVSIENHASWSQHLATAIVVPNLPSEDDVWPQLVTVQLQSLSMAEDLAQALAADKPTDDKPTDLEQAPDHQEGTPARLRLDAPHTRGRHTPHARFRADVTTAAPAEEQQDRSASNNPQTPSSPASEFDSVHAQRAENEGWPPKAEELTFAEPIAEPHVEPLASDPDPVENPAPTQTDEENIQAAVKPKPALPLWEVDRFHWPRTCEKLMADSQGYFSRAGDKLLAAVEDGLRVLAVTGSRRGEGRTTLALCLARAATKAGIQTAVMDADFARPQLASKIALDIAFGWQDAALGRIPLSEAAVKSLADEITILPLESSAATRSLSLADPRVTATIRAAAATFELLILDLGPISPGAKIEFPPGEACPLDAAIVLRDQRFATAAEGEAVGRMLQDAGLEAVGIAENFVVEEGTAANSVS